MLFSKLHKIMVNKVTSVGFMGGDLPSLHSTWSWQWWPTNTKDIFPWPLHFVLVPNALVGKSSDWLECKQIHNAAIISSRYEIFALHVCGTQFCWTFFSCYCRWNLVHFCQFNLVHFGFCLISNIFSCRYASWNLGMKFFTLISSIKICCWTGKFLLWKRWPRWHNWHKLQDNSHQMIRYA